MKLQDCKPFEWYFVVTCPDCRTKQAIFRDPSHGKARIRQTYEHQCDKCNSVAFYEPDDIEHYQHVIERRTRSRI